MTRILVVYHSIKGPVEQVAREIAVGAETVSDTVVEVKSILDTTVTHVLEADGVAFGCMKFYGSLTPEMTSLFEKLYPLRDRLKYTVGTAFSGSPNQYGGQEQAIELLVYAMLNACNMIVVGEDTREAGFIGGYVASQPMDDTARRVNRGLGRRLADVAERMRSGRSECIRP
jgi:multimeric flavodoxin WrbA